MPGTLPVLADAGEDDGRFTQRFFYLGAPPIARFEFEDVEPNVDVLLRQCTRKANDLGPVRAVVT